MNNKSIVNKIISILIAVTVWQLACFAVGESILLPSPIDVTMRFFQLAIKKEFLIVTFSSFIKITVGFFSAFIVASFLAFLSYKFTIFETFIWPYMYIIKVVPVASFIIILLIWFSSNQLSFIISFLIVIPIVYTNIFQGLKNVDKKMLDMAFVFKLSFLKKFLFIYLPSLKPYILSAVSISVGMAWKSGIAAEVIGITNNSIGEMIYNAKLYLATTDLFSWTIVIILISIIFEKLIIFLIKKSFKLLENL